MNKRNEVEGAISKSYFFQIIFGAIIGISGSKYILSKLENGVITKGTLVIGTLFVVIAFYLSIIVHELGHLIAGKLSGFRLVTFKIGWLNIINESGKLKLKFDSNSQFAGMCSMIPAINITTNKQYVVYVLGGVLGNYFTSVFFAILIIFIVDIPYYMTLFFIIMSIVSAILGIVNLIPIASETSLSDANVLWNIVRKTQSADKILEINKNNSFLFAGIRPKELVVQSEINFKYPQINDLLLILQMYYKFLDLNDIEKMMYYTNLLEDNIKILPKDYYHAVNYELCYINSITKNELKAFKYYEASKSSLIKDKDVNANRVKAYFEYYINGDVNLALQYSRNGIEVADKYPIKGIGNMEFDLIKRLEDIINKRRKTSDIFA